MRPVVPSLTSIGNVTQVRMMTQAPRPTITRHTAPVRLQTPINVPRMVNSTQIRAGSGATIIQQPPNVQIQSHPPALHPVSQNTFAPGGAQVSEILLIIHIYLVFIAIASVSLFDLDHARNRMNKAKLSLIFTFLFVKTTSINSLNFSNFHS